MIKNLAISLLFFATTFFFRVDQAFINGFQFPINDQWLTEYTGLYKKYVEGSLHIGDFFAFSNEHIVALQKLAHLGLFIALGEWNIFAQLVFNALLWSLLVGLGVFFAGYLVSFPHNRIFQVLILCCSMLPIAAENFLWGFQTGWYLYYFASIAMVYGLYRCHGLDGWWFFALCTAILSCLCLASGMVNLLLCACYPAARRWLFGISWPKILTNLGAGFLFVLIPLVYMGSHFLSLRTGEEVSLPVLERLFNGLAVFSFPLFFIPATYLPFLFSTIFLLRKKFRNGTSEIPFAILLGTWAFLHALAIVAGRGGFSGRHSEALLIGIVANALLIPFLLGECGPKNNCLITAGAACKLPRALCVLWLAAIFGGLGLQFVRTANHPELFYLDAARRQEVLARAFTTGSLEDLKSRDYSTGVPNVVLPLYPELLNEETLLKVLPNYYRKDMQLSPAPNPALVKGGDHLFADPFPNLLWFKIEKFQNPIAVQASVSNVSSPWMKLLVAGRAESLQSGIFSGENATNRFPERVSFSQPSGWRTVFLPVSNSAVAFNAKVQGNQDWLLVQQPVFVSSAQYYLEAFGRLARYLFAVALAGSVFLIIAAAGLEIQLFMQRLNDGLQ